MTLPLVIGLTGGIGVGKSTVADLLGARGATVVDVDGLGRQVLAPEGGAYAGVVEAFGDGVVAEDGTIDRASLADEVFSGDGRLAELEAISHPAINRELARVVSSHGSGIVVLDMAVLAESTLGHTPDGGRLYQRVVVVEAPMELRLARLAGRGTAEDEARRRMGAQASDTDRRALADVVLVNDGDLGHLGAAVDVIWPSMQAWRTQVGGSEAS